MLNSEPVCPLSIVRAHAIGLMRMEDEGKKDDQLVAVQTDEAAYADCTSHNQLPQHLEREIRRFFEDYEELVGRRVVVDGFVSAADARQVLAGAVGMYKQYRNLG